MRDFYGSVLLTCRILHSPAEVAQNEFVLQGTLCKTSTYQSIICESLTAGLLWPPSCYQTHFDARARAKYLERVS